MIFFPLSHRRLLFKTKTDLRCSLTLNLSPKSEGIVALPKPSPLPTGEGIKGRGKGGEKRKINFHASSCPGGEWKSNEEKHQAD